MADAGGAWAKVALDAAAMAAQAAATGMKIDEGISDYSSAISDINAQIGETQAEAARRIANTKAEGVAGLKEMGKEAGYQSGLANTQAQLVVSAGKARIGASGVRAAGSPLLAQQQTEALAREAAARKTESGNAGVAMGGLRLTNQLADINAQATLTTNEYQRRKAEAERKKKYLEENKGYMMTLAAAGGLPGFGEDFFNAL